MSRSASCADYGSVKRRCKASARAVPQMMRDGFPLAFVVSRETEPIHGHLSYARTEDEEKGGAKKMKIPVDKA